MQLLQGARFQRWRQVLFINDACHSGGAVADCCVVAREGARNSDVETLLSHEAYQVIASTTRTMYSYANPCTTFMSAAVVAAWCDGKAFDEHVGWMTASTLAMRLRSLIVKQIDMHIAEQIARNAAAAAAATTATAKDDVAPVIIPAQSPFCGHVQSAGEFIVLNPRASLAMVPPMPTHYHKRTAEVDALVLALHDDTSAATSTTVISGSAAVVADGGIGKTTLATAYAHEYAHEYTHVLWLRASDMPTLMQSYRAACNHIPLALPEDAKDEQVVSGVKQWLCTHGGWLLVVDGLDDVRNESMHSALRLNTNNGRVLVSTRYRDASELPFQGCTRVCLDLWSEAECIEFLREQLMTCRPDVVGSESDLANLVRAVDRLPLALEHAAAYLRRRPTKTAAAYVALLERDLTVHLSAEVPLEQRSVLRTFGPSVEAAAEQCAVVRTAVRVLACIDTTSVSVDVLVELVRRVRAMEEGVGIESVRVSECEYAVDTLVQWSLLQMNVVEKTVWMHDVVRDVGRAVCFEREVGDESCKAENGRQWNGVGGALLTWFSAISKVRD